MIPDIRSRTVVAVVLALLTVAAPVTGAVAVEDLDATGDDALSPSMNTLPDDTVRYGSGTPGFAVKVESADDIAALRDWANSSGVRELQATHGGNWSVVSAPKSELTGGIYLASTTLFGFDVPTVRDAGLGLAERSYVVAVEPQTTAGTDPVESLISEEQYTKPPGASYVAFSRPGEQSFDPSGLAFDEDANVTSIRDDREATGSTNVSTNTSGLLVAVIDTGANTKDGELFGNGTAGSDIRIHPDSKNFVASGEPVVDADNGNYSAVADGNTHGTHVASTIAANTTKDAYDGYAPKVELLILKALDDEGSGSTDDIADAIRYAADKEADVASLSLGSQAYSQQIAEAVAYAQDKGTVVVVAAGNSRPLFVASPADTPGPTITVGAANTPENISNARPAYFSQPGPDNGQDSSNGVTVDQNITVVAPGMKTEAMIVTDGGTRQPVVKSGTSMATPEVSGGILQFLAANPGFKGNVTGVHHRLVTTARPLPHAAEADVGAGMLAVDRMVQNTTGNTTQHEAMTEAAVARDAGVRALSDASGGTVYGIATGSASVLDRLTGEE